jgi:hypothetical protein
MMLAPVFDHLASLSTPIGLFEHALLTAARRDHGYCLDDVARGLIVTTRQPHPSATVVGLRETYLEFTLRAQDASGRFHNRRGQDGAWTDEPGIEDHWGRALWALGTTAATSDDPRACDAAVDAARAGMRLRSPWWHAMAYAALGAFEVLTVRPGDSVALDLLTDARAMLGSSPQDPSWPWPEARLTYANAVLPEALIAIGASLEDDGVLGRGLDLLHWVVAQETREDHLSLTPAGGWQPGDPRPGFDQQPVEAAALAEACWRAFRVTADNVWLRPLDRCVRWFSGLNDTGMVLYDPITGGGRDGLQAEGVNENQGAESTLAALATLQLGRLSSAEPMR